MKKIYNFTLTLTFILLLNINCKAAVFNNNSLITINDNAASSLYPSPITVSGLSGTVTSITVTINGLTHGWVSDVSIILQSPTGQSLLLQSGTSDGDGVTNYTYTFSDAGATQMPSLGLWANNGTYKPTGYFWDIWPAPAPPTPPGIGTYNAPGPFGPQTATLASTFNGLAPNGTWKLFVADFFSGDAGLISNGWTLNIVSGVPTPLDLIDFSVKKENDFAILNWLTSNEENVDYFNIEKSMDGINFERVSQINAKGVNLMETNYNTSVQLNENSINYFRLKCVDNDLKFQYSKVLTIDNRKLDNTVQIHPNIIENNFTISSNDIINSIYICDINGNIVFKTNPFLKNLSINKNAINLAKGIYFVNIISESGKTSKKIVVL